MASPTTTFVGKSILKKTQVTVPQTESRIDSGSEKFGRHHVKIDFFRKDIFHQSNQIQFNENVKFIQCGSNLLRKLLYHAEIIKV